MPATTLEGVIVKAKAVSSGQTDLALNIINDLRAMGNAEPLEGEWIP
ncbi:hypothetical protein [Methylobacterium nodulans]|nr:hypothetical protein [Methylobacterium nodulans]